MGNHFHNVLCLSEAKGMDINMKLGVISDIHSNVIAFRAAVAALEAKGCEEYLFLGDYVSDTPYTRETLDDLYDFMKAHRCSLLRGNREDYMLTQHEVRKNGIQEQFWINNSASGNLLYTYEQLTEEDFAFFESLPISFRYEREGCPAITCCHGSPDNNRELLQLGGDNTKRWLEKVDTDYLLCAHTHFPGEFPYMGKHYFNSGCVGISINDAGYAQCMTLELTETDGGAAWKPEFMKVPYDNRRVVDDIVSCGLLDRAPWFINSNIQTLLTGEDHAAELCALAAELSEAVGEKNVWPLIGEDYFAQAVEALGIPDYRRRQGDRQIRKLDAAN